MSQRCRFPVAFTGAGISAASGLPTFDSYWRGRPVRDFLSREFFERNPETFYEFFWESIFPWTSAQPNPAHLALAKFEIPVVTQNIDGLHQKAGSRRVCEIHGHLRELICPACRTSIPLNKEEPGKVPRCAACGGILSPCVVLFGDELMDWEESVRLILRADLVLVVGSSLQVAPACWLPEMAARRGAEVLIFNERAEEELPAWLETNLGRNT